MIAPHRNPVSVSLQNQALKMNQLEQIHELL